MLSRRRSLTRSQGSGTRPRPRRTPEDAGGKRRSHRRSGARDAHCAQTLRRRARRAGGLGVPDGDAGRDRRGGAALRRLLPQDAARRCRSHVPHLTGGSERDPARPVPRRALRSGGVPPRPAVAGPRGTTGMMDWLTRLVARVPATVHAKLLASFLAIVVLLLIVGAVGLRALSDVNRRAEDMVKLQRKIAAYRQLQHDTTGQLYAVASTLLVPDERTLEATLRRLNQFGYDLDRLQFVARDEVELLGQVREDYDQFIKVVTRVIELIRAGKAAEGREVQLTQAGPLADRP